MYFALKANLESPVGRKALRIYDTSRCTDNPLYEQYESFFKFAIRNRDQSWKDLVADPFYVYILEYDEGDTNAPRNEAYARRQLNGMNIIGIGNLLFEGLYQKCRAAYLQLDQVAKLHQIDVPATLTVPIDYYSFLIARHFLFYHELAHLMQGNTGERVSVSESYILGNSKTFEEDKHVKELDADLVGANITIDHVLYHFNNLPRHLQTQKNGEDLVALAIIGIFFLFDLLSNGLQAEIFFKHGTHPHPAVRIRSILENMAEKFVQVQKWPPSSVFRITARFLEMLSKVTTSEVHRRYLGLMVDSSGAIQRYRSEMFKKMTGDKTLAWKKIKDKAGEIPPIRF